MRRTKVCVYCGGSDHPAECGRPLTEKEITEERKIRARVRVTYDDVEAIESLSDAAMRANCPEVAVKGYALALRLRSETGFQPLRRADDEPST